MVLRLSNRHKLVINAPKKEEERLPALHVTVNKSKPISVDIYCYTTVCIISQRKPSIYGFPSDKGRRVPLQGSARPNAKISALGLPRMTRQIGVELWPIVAQHKVGLTLMKQALEPVVFYWSPGEQEQNLWLVLASYWLAVGVGGVWGGHFLNRSRNLGELSAGWTFSNQTTVPAGKEPQQLSRHCN